MLENISIRAGSRAIKIIREEGLNLARVKVLAGASGSAKFLVLAGLDKVLISMLKGRKKSLYLLGTSIGAFRMAAFCQSDPLAAIETLEREYIDQQYVLKPSKEEITGGTLKILNAYIDDQELSFMLNHPFMRLNFLSNRCKGLLKSDHYLGQCAGLGVAAGLNLLRRKFLGFCLERALFHPPGKLPPFSGMSEFPLVLHSLTPQNFKTALLSSGSIPLAMSGVSNIQGVPGVFMDGGILDYHLDLPFLPEDRENLVLFPHFYETITPGWFDKSLKRNPSASHMENVVVIAPSQKFIHTLPFSKIPDRKDFYAFKGNDQQRKIHWKNAADQSRLLGEDFFEAVQSGKIRHMVKPLKTTER